MTNSVIPNKGSALAENSRAKQLLQQDPASQLLGITLISQQADECLLSMVVSRHFCNGYHVCHGGFIYTLADTAAAFAASETGQTILSANNQVEYLASAKQDDKLLAAAKVTLRNGKIIFCEVTVNNQNGETIALVRGKLVRQSKN